MANNKALLTTLEGTQESLRITRDAQLWADHWCAIEAAKNVKAEAQLLRIARFKRKFPSVAALIDATP